MKSALLASLLVATAAQTATGQEGAEPPETVDRVDLERYTGVWHEFARLPNRFQEQCAADVTAEYSLRDDGRLTVVNRCRTHAGALDEATGIARIVDTESNARLEVSFVRIFGLSLFWGDYWVLGLGPEYEYAVVGTPDREYGWLLVRDPVVSEDLADEMFFILEARGYRHRDFVITPRSSEGELD